MKIVEAPLIDKPILSQLLDQYLSELKIHREIKIGAINALTYKYLDTYWQEKGRHPFLFYIENHLVGFSFIRDSKSTESECSQVAEFYIIPEERRQGIGKRAAIKIFDLFPGKWELQVHSKNKSATMFWEKCIKLKAKCESFISEITAADGKRIQFNFTV